MEHEEDSDKTKDYELWILHKQKTIKNKYFSFTLTQDTQWEKLNIIQDYIYTASEGQNSLIV